MNLSLPPKRIRATFPLALTVATLLVGCLAASRTLPTPEDLLETSAVPHDADPQALRRGRALAVTSCASCHRLYWPEEYPPETWNPIVDRMAPLASLNTKQRADLLAYLQAASRLSHTPKAP